MNGNKILREAVTGLAVPLFSLKSADDSGIGEFADLLPLARWAKKTGIKIIQILPVNDTGFENSPYSALSAFALNPVYARIKDFPEYKKLSENNKKNYSDCRCSLQEENGYKKILSAKLSVIKSMWEIAGEKSFSEAENWLSENPWAAEYSLYKVLKEENGDKPWYEWSEHRDTGLSSDGLKVLWNKKKNKAMFYVWMQLRLEQQFRSTAENIDRTGLYLKGDIPILISRDSADVWANRSNFHLELTAGAPPDAVAPQGQNWGFPVYNWEKMKNDGYLWWKARLKQADKFYHALRIDHVIGFFRIWSIPENEITAQNGFFTPVIPVTEKDLSAAGFDPGRIIWLTRPHFSGDKIRTTFKHEAPVVEKILEKLDGEDLWRTPDRALSEKDVMNSELSSSAKQNLIKLLKDRTFIKIRENEYFPSLDYKNSSAWCSLSENEKIRLENLLADRYSELNILWKNAGREHLSMLKENNSMLLCAEDLGTVPDFIPEVLNELKIPGLRIIRWCRYWNKKDRPYIPFEEYPVYSVITTSVHDTTTLREWLEKEGKEDWQFWKLIRTKELTTFNILEKAQNASSLLAVYPLADLLSIDPDCVDKDPAQERINIPGTIGGNNWKWRMKIKIEDLNQRRKLNNDLKLLCRIRKNRTIKNGKNTVAGNTSRPITGFSGNNR